MKKNNRPILLISIVFLFLSLFLGCEKEPVDQGYGPIAGQPTIIPSQSLVNGQVIISWTSKDATIVTCNGVAVATTGDLNFPVCDTVLNFVAKNEKFKATKKITVVKPTAPTLSVKTDKSTISFCGDQVKFTWTSTGADLVYYNGVPYYDGNVGITLSTPATELDTLSFIFVAKGKGGETTETIKLPVDQPTDTEKLLYHDGKEWICYRSEWSDTLNGVRYQREERLGMRYLFTICPSYQLTKTYNGFTVTNSWSVDNDGTFTYGNDSEHYKILVVSGSELYELSVGVNISDGSLFYCWNYYH